VLLDLIEHTRKEMLSQASLLGFTSSRTVLTSQKLDCLLNFYHSFIQKNQNSASCEAMVNPIALRNILDACYVYQSSLLIEKSELDPLHKVKNKWHSLTEVESLLQYLEAQYGEEILYHIGYYVPKYCYFPEEINSFESSLTFLNTAYHLNHANDRTDRYSVEFIDDKVCILTTHTPFYSNMFNLGLVRGLAEKYNGTILHIEEINSRNGGQFKIVIK
jgi:hypothetical protein